MATDKRKSLLILLDLKQKELDNFRQIQQRLLAQKEQFEKILASLKLQLEQERKAAEQNISLLRYLSSFTKENQDRQKQYLQAIQRIDSQLTELMEKIFGAFTELKKIEKIKEGMDQRIAAHLARLENQYLDELGIRNFSRKDMS